MKRIHIVGAGGVAGIGMTRCLKDHYTIQGHDQSQWAEKVMEAEVESENINFCDLIIPVPDKAVAKYSAHEYTILPSPEEVLICHDKAKTAELLGSLAPKTYWVRETQGAGGKGAQMCSEYLPGRNFSCELLYNKGKLIGSFTKERLSYRVGSVDHLVNGIGSSAVSLCIRSKRVEEISKAAVQRVADHCKAKPHGVYAVDLQENEDGQPKVTEINPGRFLTASYVFFYKSDFNLPLAMVKAYFNEPYELGDYPEGKGVIRQTDSLPYFGPL